MQTHEKPNPEHNELIQAILKAQEDFDKRVQLKELIYAIVD